MFSSTWWIWPGMTLPWTFYFNTRPLQSQWSGAHKGFQASDRQWDRHLASGEGVFRDKPSLKPPSSPPITWQRWELWEWLDPGKRRGESWPARELMLVEYPEGGTQAPHSSFHGFFYLVFLGKTMSKQTGKLQASFGDPCQKCSRGSWKETQASL